MGLQFVLGRANRNKRSVLLDEIAESLTNHTEESIFYLVPDHIKFQAEMTVLGSLSQYPYFKNKPMMGMMHLQVFSFTRLAWYWLKDTDIYAKPQLTTTGLSMLIRKLLIEHEEKLTIYRGEVRKEGFVQQMTDLFLELRSGRITQIDLDQMILNLGNSPKEADFKLKLQDLSLIYHAFDEALLNKYIESEDIVSALIQKVTELDLSETTIYIESYYQFTAQEQALILALMKAAKKVTIALTTDKAYAVEKPEMHNLFQTSGTTYYKLYQLARQNNVPVYKDKVIQEKDASYCEELNQLEDFWVETSQLSPATNVSLASSDAMGNCIEVWAAENKQAEITHVAKEIRKLVATGHYRYKDILVLTRNMDDYLAIIEPLFTSHAIELFIDSAELMNQHPLIEVIDALVSIYKRNWRYADVMRLLRTELVIPAFEEQESLSKERAQRVSQQVERAKKYREKVDITENVLLAYGYEGYHWTKTEPWHYTRYFYEDAEFQSDNDHRIEQTANSIKTAVSGLLVPFFKRLEKAKTSKDAAKELYLFMETVGVKDQIGFWRDQSIEDNNLEEARKHEQTWQTFLQLLDEYVEVLGDEPFDLDSFHAILMTGFDNATYSMVPPSIDQVTFSGIEGTRIGTAKVTFMLGVTDAHLPAKTENKSILTEEDRDFFSYFLDETQYLKPTVEAVMASEPFIAYQAFLDSSEKLIFSYPTSDETKNGPKLSPYVDRIAKAFQLPIQAKLMDITSLETPTGNELLDFVGTKKTTISQLLMVLRKEQDQKGQLNAFWQNLYMFFKRDKQVARDFKHLLVSLVKKNVPMPLRNSIATDLYGKDLYLSVSRLEAFYADHYGHFLTYGLKLKERDVFELSPAGTGEFFHDALDHLFKTIIQKNLSFDQLNEEMLEELTTEVLTELYGKPKFSILNASNRMKYIRDQLGQTIKKMVWVIGNQSRRTNMKNIQTEVLFGHVANQTGIEGLSFRLNNGGTLYLRGKIDRVDAMTVGTESYLSVVDYKSSAHKFNYQDAYYGLAMQMITYLDTALQNAVDLIGHEAKPAGAFYLHVSNPFMKKGTFLDEDAYIKELLKSYKMDGLLLEDEAMLLSLDPTIEPTTASLVYPFNQLKSEALKSTKFVTLNEMTALRQHNKKLIIDAGNKIVEGVTTLNPFYEKRQFIPTVNGPLRAVSQFDAMLPENNYRRMESLKREDILKKMQEEEEDEE
ncbi:helicase-exonuclease AddAB subunit AddB [Carnobacterium jeotgali]|uniref:helicase-exonuclease AddAB subunit AddB n=1 Tax=Carnobacterium jeotgali TaxID=545534 RepID=UPI00388FACD9